MSQKYSIGWTLLAVAGALVASGFGSAIAFNSAHTAPQAVGGGLDPLAILNWGFAAIGGSAGLLGLVKTILAQWSPGLGRVVDNPVISDLGDQVFSAIPALVVDLDSNPENDQPLKFAVTRPLKNSDVTITVVVTPRPKVVPAT